MKYRFLITGFACVLLSAGVFAQSGKQVIDLKNALNLAVKNNPALQRSMLEETKLRYRQQEARGYGLPSLTVSGGFDDYLNLPTQLLPGEFFGQPGILIPVQFGTNYNLSGSVDASQLLYNQTFLVALKMAKQALNQGRLETEQVKTNVVFEVGKSYYTTQITRIQIRNQQNILKKLEKAEQVATSQFENGIITRVDLDRITIERLNRLSELDRLEVLYQQQMSMQKYFMGIDQGQTIEFPDTIELVTIPTEIQSDLSNHINILLIDNSRNLTNTELAMKRAEYYPSLTLIGSTSYINQSNTFYLTGKNTDWFNTSLVGLRLNVPVFSGFQKRAKVNQSKIALQQINITEEDMKKQLRLGSEDAARKLKVSITAEQRQRENKALAEKVYNVTQEQYQKGIIPLTDLLNVERSLDEAQTLHVMALIQMKLSELEYRNANGTLLNLLEQQ